MNITEQHQAFRFGMDKLDNLNYPNFLPEEIDLLLNQAQDSIAKQRYGITNSKRTSFEETQKRTEDLKELVRFRVITPTPNTGVIGLDENITTNSVFCTLPSDHWFTIWERVIVNSSICTNSNITVQIPAYDTEQCRGCPTCSLESCPGDTVIVNVPATNVTISGRYADVIPTQHVEIDKILNDAFKAPDSKKVLRLMYEDNAEIIPSSDNTVLRYLLRYIKQPRRVSITTIPTVDCELSEHLHQEIVNLAIVIALEGVEAKRNNTFTPIVNNQEE